MQRLRTVTSLDVSAVAGHHAMPAALLFTHVLGQKEFFFKFQYLVVGGKLNPSSFTLSDSRKIFQTKQIHSIVLIIVHVKNWPQRSKRFNQLLKSKIQPLAACADRLTF